MQQLIKTCVHQLLGLHSQLKGFEIATACLKWLQSYCKQTRVLLLQGGGGAAAAGAAAGAGSEMDLATILATFPPDVREEVLLTSEEDVINSLPPALLAEAQQLRQRVMQHYRYVLPCDVFVSSW